MTHPESWKTTVAELQAGLEKGLSLPSYFFTDREIVEEEMQSIFQRTWQYVGRAEQVQRPGDFITGHAGNLPVVVVRAEKGLNAFVNVCRHRKHEVAKGSGNRKTLQCPYHAWTYDLDGSLRGAPRCEREPGFDKRDFPLLPMKVEAWGPWVFVNPDPTAEKLSDQLGELTQIISRSGLDLASLKFRSREEWRSDSNWKVMLENYFECYHCPVQHPGFSKVIDVDPDTYTLRSHGSFFSQTGPVRNGVETKKGLPYDPRGEVTEAQYHFIWPNFTLNINPGRPNLSLDIWLPDGPDRSYGFSETYFGPDVPEEAQLEIIAFNRQVGAEDDALTSSVQRGLRAGIPARGRFLTNSENLCVEFQKKVLGALANGPSRSTKGLCVA